MNLIFFVLLYFVTFLAHFVLECTDVTENAFGDARFVRWIFPHGVDGSKTSKVKESNVVGGKSAEDTRAALKKTFGCHP